MPLKQLMKPVWKSGYIEKDAQLPDGTIIHYAKNPDNGKPPLLLIHGQTGRWMDYATVLPELGRKYHVYAVDCHGHGQSSKKPNKYKVKEIGKDLTWFIQNIIGKSTIISGHSSGGLIASWLAANARELVRGVVLEDPPFFSTYFSGNRERWENSFAYVDTYAPLHNFLNQSEEKDWVIYYLKHAMWGKFVGAEGMAKMISYGEKYRRKHPGKPLNYFFLPDSVNHIFWFMDAYDLLFGETFYDGSWFEGYDPSDSLSRITCPAVLIHTKWFIDENGILNGAMSGDDAERANSLMADSDLVFIDSGHDSHFEKPEAFLATVTQLAQKML